jgi:antitoxin VapB
MSGSSPVNAGMANFAGKSAIDGLIMLAYAVAYINYSQDICMSQTERHVRLFRNGRNQAVRIPREFELEGEEAIMRKEGGRLIVEPIRKGRLLSLLACPYQKLHPWTASSFISAKN